MEQPSRVSVCVCAFAESSIVSQGLYLILEIAILGLGTEGHARETDDHASSARGARVRAGTGCGKPRWRRHSSANTGVLCGQGPDRIQPTAKADGVSVHVQSHAMHAHWCTCVASNHNALRAVIRSDSACAIRFISDMMCQ